MKYFEGTISVTNGSQVVTGTGTRWKAFVNPGDLITVASSGVWYVVARVLSQTELRLSVPYGGITQSGQSHTIMREFTPNYGAPYPLMRDIDKASIISRALSRFAYQIQALHQRCNNFEFPPMAPQAIYSTPDIQPVSIYVVSGLSPAPLTVVPTIGVVNLDPVSLTMTPTNATVITIIDTVYMGSIVDASNNTYTADTDTVTADGSPGISGNLWLWEDNQIILWEDSQEMEL